MLLTNGGNLSWWNLLLLLAVFTVPLICPGQSPSSSEGPKAKYSDVICTCTAVVAVGVNLTQKSGKEIILPDKNIFKIYEDGVLQELEYFTLNDDEVTKRIGFRYKLGYVPTNDKINGNYRKIRIATKVKGRRGIKIHQSMTGYLATKENQQRLHLLPAEESNSSKGCCN